MNSIFTIEQQKYIYQKVKAIDPPWYVPSTRYGKMSIKMNCLGWHWNARTYKYEKTRSDHDGLPCAEIPFWLDAVAQAGLRAVGEDPIKYDICIANFYSEAAESKLGLHRDDSETEASLDAGYPVLSISIGADCNFSIGPSRKKDDQKQMVLKSGDVITFGGEARRYFHGVSGIIKGTTPEELGFDEPGRLNLTFRVY